MVRAVTPDEVAKARSILDGTLIDFTGARFREMRLVDQGETVAICGKVNSPNRAGGMSGWQETAIIVKGRDYAPRCRSA